MDLPVFYYVLNGKLLHKVRVKNSECLHRVRVKYLLSCHKVRVNYFIEVRYTCSVIDYLLVKEKPITSTLSLNFAP